MYNQLFPITAGSDFQQTVGVFEFLAGATRDCITIPIVDDEIAETPEEVFNVVIELQPTTANINTGRITSRVTVVDDDCKEQCIFIKAHPPTVRPHEFI